MRRDLALLLLLAACKGDKDADTTDDDVTDTSDTDADTDADTDSDTDTDVDEFGLDTRPANPGCVAVPRPLGDAQAQLTRVYSGVSFSEATTLSMAPGNPSRWYVTEQPGRVWWFDDDPAVSTRNLALDITGAVDDSGNEMGLLGLAFHPDFQTNGYVYAYYSRSGGSADHVSRLSRFTSPDGGDTFDPGSEQVLLEVDQPYSNHNGGSLLFGPDGFLYLGLGDGGSAHDPGQRAQNPNDLLGKILRIDVDGGSPYAIPADNPYASGGGLPEIYAIGLRNPYRFTFDPQGGDLWVGDVGQNAFEEIDKVELGGNYGWDIREGFECHEPSKGCASAGLIDPWVVIEHTGSSKSIIAGAVYHGDAIPSLRGVLLYNDFYDGDIYAMFLDPVTAEPVPQEIVSNTGRLFGHYAAGPDNELYLLDYLGQVYKLEPLGKKTVDPFPQRLSETGCFDPADPTQPAAGLVPYEVAHGFWSDGGDKRRWLALPDGASITVGADGDWELPIGSVLAKEFTVNGQLVETRLMMRHDDGDWGGYAYAWDTQQSDATLLYSGLQVDAGGQTWSIPDNGECSLCHNTAAGGSLGLESRQLDTLADYPSTGRTANQIDTLTHIGMLDPLDPATVDPYPALDDAAASLEERARAYLHVNCAICHQPDGPSRTDLDFRASTALADTNACDADPVHGDLGVAGAKVIAPGDPSLSLVSLRMHVRDANQMPPFGSNVVDTDGAQLIDDWITSLSGCP